MIYIVTDNNYCVYTHINKINNKQYIGLTGQEPLRRWGKNGSGYCQEHQPLFRRAIEKYGWDNFDHIIISDNLTFQEAIDLEVQLIEKFNTQDPNFGYNIQPGGSLGNKGLKFSEKTKRKISEAHKGKHLSDEHKKKISEGCKGHKPAIHSEEFKQKMRELNTGKIMPEETKQKISKALTGMRRSQESICKMKEHNPLRTPVYCPELDMIFDSINEASRYTDTPQANIRKCLKGERKSAGKHKTTNEKLHWEKVEK